MARPKTIFVILTHSHKSFIAVQTFSLLEKAIDDFFPVVLVFSYLVFYLRVKYTKGFISMGKYGHPPWQVFALR